MDSHLIRKSLVAAVVAALALTMGCSKDEEKKAADGKKPAASAQAKASAEKKDGAKTGAKGAAGAAHAHLSKDCDVVAYINITSILQAAPIKAHVVPALEEMKKTEAKKEEDKSFRAFLAETGIDPLKDLHAAAVCITNVKAATTGGGEPDMSFVLSGNLKKDAVVPAVLKTGKKDKFKETELAGMKVLTNPEDDFFMGQASDGAVIAAKSKAAFEAALKTTDAATTVYKLPLDKAVSIVVPAKTITMAMEAGGKDNPFKDSAKKAGRAAVSVDFNAGTIEVRISMSEDKAATELVGVAKMLLGQMTQGPPKPGPEGMAMQFLKDAKIESVGKDFVATITVPKAALEDLAKEMAKGIKAEMK
jgi:hypothetical protein